MTYNPFDPMLNKAGIGEVSDTEETHDPMGTMDTEANFKRELITPENDLTKTLTQELNTSNLDKYEIWWLNEMMDVVTICDSLLKADRVPKRHKESIRKARAFMLLRVKKILHLCRSKAGFERRMLNTSIVKQELRQKLEQSPGFPWFGKR